MSTIFPSIMHAPVGLGGATFGFAPLAALPMSAAGVGTGRVSGMSGGSGFVLFESATTSG